MCRVLLESILVRRKRWESIDRRLLSAILIFSGKTYQGGQYYPYSILYQEIVVELLQDS